MDSESRKREGAAPAVSIVMPVYNAEQHLPACLDAIVAQTFHDFEVIAMNDGSTDRSGEILEAYAERDPRIRVIHQENIGQYPSRNKALGLVRGRYMLSVDCDDVPKHEIVAKLFYRAEAMDADIAIAGWGYIEGPFRSPDLASWNLTAFSGGVHGERFPMGYGYMWMKLYRMSFLKAHGFGFEERFFSKCDLIFHWQTMSLATRVIVIPEELYLYRVHEASVTGRIGRRFNEVMSVMECIRSSLQEIGDPRGLLEYWPAFAGGFVFSAGTQMPADARPAMIEEIREFLGRLSDAERVALTSDGRLSIRERRFFRCIEDGEANERVARMLDESQPSWFLRLRALIPEAAKRRLIEVIRRSSYSLRTEESRDLESTISEMNEELHELSMENARLKGEVRVDA